VHYSLQWQVPLGVVSKEEDEVNVRQALEQMGQSAAALATPAELTADAILEAVAAQQSQLVIIGDDPSGPLSKRSRRVTVEEILPRTPVPMLIYR